MFAWKRARQTPPPHATTLIHVLSGLSNSSTQRVLPRVLDRCVVFGLDLSQFVRFGHFDYLKEDSDDEHKRVEPADRLQTNQLVRSVSLADKLVCESEIVNAKRQDKYRRNNAPPEPHEKKWGSWLNITDGRKKYKFDPDYSSVKLFEQMNFSGGGTIPENPSAEMDDDRESRSTLSELGKGSSTNIRILGDRMENRSDAPPKVPDASRVDPNVGFDRLPTLYLGRQYDTGLKFDRTRPTIRKDRYAMSWTRPEIEPKKRTDGSLDTRPVLEFDLAKTDAVKYLGGDKLKSSLAATADALSITTDLEDMGVSSMQSGEARKSSMREDDVQPVGNFVPGYQPLGAHSRQTREGPGFRFMTNWQQIYDAFRNLVGENKAEEIAHAFFALKQIKPPPPNHVLLEMADTAIQHAHEMMPIGLVNVLHACAKMRFLHHPLLKQWEKQFSDPRVLEACTDLDITCLVYSFGVLNRLGNSIQYREQNPDKWNKGLDFEFIQKLATEAVHPVRMENYNYSMMVNVLYGLALLKFDGREILNKLIQEITRDSILPRLEMQNVSAAIYALGYVRFWAPDEMKKLLKEAIAHIEDFPSQNIANILWSLGNLRYPDAEMVGKIATAAAEEKHLRNYVEQDLTSILYGMAMSRFRDPAVIGAFITEIMRPGRLPQMQDSTLTHLLSSFSSLRHSNRHLFNVVLKELSSPKRLKNLRNMHIANVFYALGACRYDDVSALQQIMDEIMDLDRLPSFSDFDISTIVHGSGSLRIKDEKFVTSIMTEASKTERMERYSSQSLANMINACSLLQYKKEEVLLPACHELARAHRVRQMTPANISLSSFALCRLQFYDSKYFSAYLAEATNPERIKLIRPSTLIDLMFGSVRADVVHFVQFMEIIKLMRDPRRVNYLLNFPLVRLISVAAVHGLRDDAFLNTIKDELLKEARERSLTNVERREIARSLERLGCFDEELCARLNYGRRVEGQSIGILAPGGLREAEREEKQRALDREQEERNLDWAGQMRPTFYSS